MKVSIAMAVSMALASINGTMAPSSPEIGTKTRYSASASTSGLTADPTRVNGGKTTWKAWEFTAGKTAEFTTANTKTIRNMVTEFTSGKTIENTQATGQTVSSMAWVCTPFKKRTESSTVYGKMARESNGLALTAKRKSMSLKLTILSFTKTSKKANKDYLATALLLSLIISKIGFLS